MRKPKRFCKVAAFFACILLGWAFIPIMSYAREIGLDMEPRMTYISTYDTELSISGSGVATITGSVKGVAGVTSTYVKVTLQKNVSDEWVDVESWEKSSNGRRTTISETYQVSKGTYRVVMTCSANSETKTATSASRTY